MKKYKNKKDFIEKQLKDSLAKTQGAINLIDNSSTHFARNKMLGLYQKIGYILQKINAWDTLEGDFEGDNESNKDS